MDIPYNSPINFDKFEALVKEKVKAVEEKGMFVTNIILNPETIHEIANYKMNKIPYGVQPSLIFVDLCHYKMLGNPDLRQYEFRFEVASVYEKQPCQ